MSIPATITAQLANLQAQVTAATPLTGASRATVQAMQINAAQLVSDVQAALVTPDNTLDTWIATENAVSIISGILGLSEAALDQSKLALMRGVVARAASNLEQLS